MIKRYSCTKKINKDARAYRQGDDVGPVCRGVLDVCGGGSQVGLLVTPHSHLHQRQLEPCGRLLRCYTRERMRGGG